MKVTVSGSPTQTRVASLSELQAKKPHTPPLGLSPSTPTARPPLPANLLPPINLLPPVNIPGRAERTSTGSNDSHGSNMTFSTTVARRVGGISKSWKETELRIDPLGNLTLADTSFVLSGSRAEVPSVFDAKLGQRFLFTLIDANQTKEQLQLANASELDECLQVLANHGCAIHSPIKAGHMTVDKKQAWCVLYSDCFHYFKAKTDPKPTKVVQITEATLFERGDDQQYILAESGDEQANSVSFSLSSAEEKEWLELLEQTVASRADKKCPDSLLEGYMWKCGETGGFKHRFCVLRLDNIRYYKRRFDEQAAGIIRLNPGAEAGPADDSSHYKHQFWVAESGDEGIRKYLMAAKTEADKELWLRTINEVFASKDNQVHSLSLHEGYLHKRTKKGLWKKYYFILLKDMVMFRKKRSDFIYASETPKGMIDLNQAFEFHVVHPSSEPGLNKLGLFTLAANGDEEGTRTYMLHAEDDDKRKIWMNTLSDLRKTKNLNVNPKSVKEGYLMKRAAKRDKWSKRYFILLEDRLLYYRRRLDTVERGEIKIEGAAEIAELEPEDRDSEHKFRFSVVESGDDEGKRMYFISCLSAKERQQWMSCITKIIKSHDARVMPGSLLEGYLWKCSKTGGAWQKRYFILKPGQLIYLKKRLDKTQAGAIEIKGEALVSLISDPEHPFAFSVAENGDDGVSRMLLQTQDDAMCNEWVSQLRHQASLYAVKEVPDSVLEGYVYLRSGSSWRKRYFILERSPPTLSLFTKRKDMKPAVKMSIDKQTVAVLLDSKIPFHGSLWGRHEGEDLPATMFHEEKEVAEGGDEKEEETVSGKTSEGIQMIIAKNGDAGAKVIRLKGAGESEALLISKITELCVSEEFPNDSPVLKNGYVMVRFQAKSDKWVSSYVEITPDRLMCFKARDDEVPVLASGLDEGAQIFMGVLPGSGEWNPLAVSVIDKTGREISMRAQSEEEKVSWATTITKCIRDGQVRRVTLFGGDLKTSFANSTFYNFPAVIGACVDFLRKSPVSGCLLRHPGFLPLVRSLIQDFELKLEVVMNDTWSVAACLKLYLMMLPKPIILDTLAKGISEILKVKPNDPANPMQIAKLVKGLDYESSVALNVLLYYLAHEVSRPDDVELTLTKVASVWAPLLIRSTEVGEEEKALVIGALIRSVKIVFPVNLVPVKKPSATKLQQLKAECELTFEDLRKDAYGLRVYARFVKDNFIDENLQFFNAVEKYREMCSNSKFSAAQRSAAGAEICKKFVVQGAEIQINVSASLSATILARFDEKANRTLLGSEFAEAEMECSLLEATNSYPRFKKTECYDEWIAYRHEKDQELAAARPRKTILGPAPQAVDRRPPPRPPTNSRSIPIISTGSKSARIIRTTDETSPHLGPSGSPKPPARPIIIGPSIDEIARLPARGSTMGELPGPTPPARTEEVQKPTPPPRAEDIQKPTPPARTDDVPKPTPPARTEDASKPTPPARSTEDIQKPTPPPRSTPSSESAEAPKPTPPPRATPSAPASPREPNPPARAALMEELKSAPASPHRPMQSARFPLDSKPAHPPRAPADDLALLKPTPPPRGGPAEEAPPKPTPPARAPNVTSLDDTAKPTPPARANRPQGSGELKPQPVVPKPSPPARTRPL